ncbi:hypothetical protein JYU34_022030 [Plutella xylostella]|uniref:Uncharacterized protein n=1 Tax=Plutella xylostella TaxID=51655 RepID=A0ABQ7PQC6_PLUXY|nr:hypothetical protein JYU34_022030 [Plutella xylostella]
MLNSKQITVEERNELEDNNTALHHAASEGHLQLVKILVEEFKANVNAKNDRDEIPLQKAVDHYFVRVVRYLIQHKSERAEYAAKMTNPQPIEDFFVAAENNDVAKVTEMLKNKVVDVDATDAGHDNGTALHVAARYDYLDLAKALVEFGADTEVTDDIGDRPVETAVILQKTKVADYLIELEGKD